MAYLAAMSAHCPQALQPESSHRRVIALRRSFPKSCAKSESFSERQAMRSEDAAKDRGSSAGGAGFGGAVAPKNPAGKSDGSQYPFAMNMPLPRQECGERVFCQLLVRRMSADASDFKTSATSALSSGEPVSGLASRSSSSAWAHRSAAKSFTREGDALRRKAAKSWVLSKRSVEQLDMAGAYPAEGNAIHDAPVARGTVTSHGAQARPFDGVLTQSSPPDRGA